LELIAVVRLAAGATSRLFYRIDRVGAPPASGAALLLPNHPNALLDPAVIWSTAGRDVRFLAKSTLFDGPLGPLMRGAGAIPVYRRLDQGVDVSKNTETFAAVDRALAAGDAISIFPEGISHSTGRLEPLRTGAARMALGAEHAGVPVALVPVGLNFERKTAFRSRVTVVYGAAFSCRDLADRGSGDPEAVRMLTARMGGHMRRLVVEADPKGDAALVDRVDRLYAAARGRHGDSQDRIERRRAIARGMERLRAADSRRHDEILLRIRRYDERLQRFGLRDRHLDWRVSVADAIRFAARELLFGVVLGPVALVAIVAFAATAKAVGGALIYAAWLAVLAAGVWFLSGPRLALLVGAALTGVAVAGLFAIERESAVLDAVRAWLLLRRTRDDTKRTLLRRRSELADVLDDANRWVTAEEREGVSRQ